jgi:EAL domain-containing protein (putative c-di-GMP-specific phosphodiesterase class I)/DNA-binding CsgD family transcriptional regulator
LGLIGPDEFVPALEAAGRIPELGRLVLERACGEAAAWHRDGGTSLHIAVNVSPLQLADDGFPEVVHETIARSGLAPQHIWLEITESAHPIDLSRARRLLDPLVSQGVHVTLDDFGVGSSSLDRLRQLPVEAIKVDRSFIASLSEGEWEQRLVASLIRFAHDLSIRVVAEGVETVWQRRLLDSIDCGFGQGWLWSVPLSSAGFAHWMRVYQNDRASAPVRLPRIGGDSESPPMDRVPKLERRLMRIAADIDAWGLVEHVDGVADPFHRRRIGELSVRQRDVLARLVRGQRVATIAAETLVTSSAIRKHLSAIFDRFGVHSQSDLLTLLSACAVAEERKLVPPSDMRGEP